MRFVFMLFIAFTIFFANIDSSKGISFNNQAMAASSDEGVKDAPEYEYFQMSPLMIPIIQHGGISQQVSFVISIEVPYGNLNKVERYQPRLADAFIQDLYGVLGAGYGLVNGSVLNVQAIKQRLYAVTQKVLGDEMATDVLLQVVQQRPL